MSNREILRFSNGRDEKRITGSPGWVPTPKFERSSRQRRRIDEAFESLQRAINNPHERLLLQAEPYGVAPERTLVFVTAGEISNFNRTAQAVGLEILSEIDYGTDYIDPLSNTSNEDNDPVERQSSSDAGSSPTTLYATLPSLASARHLIARWNRHQRGQEHPYGEAPWGKLFDNLKELRSWGPRDRLAESTRAELVDRLSDIGSENDQLNVEIELWPSADEKYRNAWNSETESAVNALGGTILDRANIDEIGFHYFALLVSLPASAVQQLIDVKHPSNLLTIDGIRHVLPQTLACSFPYIDEEAAEDTVSDGLEPFSENAPYRALLLDGTPVAGHPVLEGGVAIEDIHGIVPISPVVQRLHATSMASLILRGDLEVDGKPIAGALVLSIPVLIDRDRTSFSPENRLFVDMVHTALHSTFEGKSPLAESIFVVNVSLGLHDSHFSGQVSRLAHLLDWWSARAGVLFVVAAGNVTQSLQIPATSMVEFDLLPPVARREAVEDALLFSAHTRTLLAPAEAINALTVGSASIDSVHRSSSSGGNGVKLHDDHETTPSVASGLGPGPGRCIKPDLLNTGGLQYVTTYPMGDGIGLMPSRRPTTGVRFASPARERGGQNTSLDRGTSIAAALTTRYVLQSANALVAEGGPYPAASDVLSRFELALLTRALLVNSSHWSDAAWTQYERAKQEAVSPYTHAKESILRQYGYGVISESRLLASPENGVTVVGTGTIRKDDALIFDLPLPPSLSSVKLSRSMQVTLAWFSPVSMQRPQYRQAALHAVVADEGSDIDKQWGLNLKTDTITEDMIGRGTVWSRRLTTKQKTTPAFDANASLPIRVQCQDSARGTLDPDLDIHFAIVLTLVLEAEVDFDIHDQIKQQLKTRVRAST